MNPEQIAEGRFAAFRPQLIAQFGARADNYK
jgi:hypothetical protein